ncbi:MAG: dihydroorotate dehydrogenase electron transfer subunit [Patescibacteria group bacterium]|jgi:dihydroorotate dehydrogenase electron transfer subunit
MKRYDQPKTLKIAEIRDEGRNLKTFFFAHPIESQPGQFIMLWIPGVNLKPFGVAYHEPERFGITVSMVGPTTEALFKKKKGDWLGFTGPYGTSFQPNNAQHLVLVGGGYGAAILAPLADKAAAEGATVDFIVGAHEGDRILYEQRYAKSSVNFYVTTNDGSRGEKGRATNILERLVDAGGVDYITTCGPERMLHAIATFAEEKNIRCEVSVERYMKCGFGVCGACALDGTGERVCVEGTVFPAKRALAFSEFGQYHRARSGKKIGL